ncbi:MAG: NAD(P)H-hydrate dehydratase [Candidatus Helarchaeota archaeon]
MENFSIFSFLKDYEREEITPKEMAIIDRNCTYLGIPASLLMENAGRAVCQNLLLEKKEVKENIIYIFAGTGNNGGDAFVAARHLSYYKPKINVLLLGKSSQIRTETSKMNWNALERMQFSINRLEITNTSQLENIKNEILSADILIDGLLGTGIRGRLREPISSVIDLINNSKGFKISIDIPSGLDPLNGTVHDKAVRADITITFHKKKIGLKNNEEYVGKLVVSEIGIPIEAEFIVGSGDLQYLTRPRKLHSHKGDFGKVLVIGGSKFYTGAPALVGLAAYRAGADLVIITAPEKITNNLRNFSPNLIVRDLPGNILTEAAMPLIEKLINWSSSVAIGPGLGVEKETVQAVLKIVEKTQKLNIPLVIDADALKAISTNLDKLITSQIVLTPHQGEFQIISGSDLTNFDLKTKVTSVVEFAKKIGVTILLKGHEDIVSNGKNIKINLTGTPAMTVGGTGDVLTGIIACLIGQKIDVFEAAASAAFINGRAGELASKKYYGNHLMATDLIDLIPKAMKIES